jgi:hypothetical protein
MTVVGTLSDSYDAAAQPTLATRDRLDSDSMAMGSTG